MLAIRDGVREVDRIVARILLGDIALLPITPAVCETWAKIVADVGRSAGKKSNDLWIAATALSHALPLVTNNPRDFEGISGLEIVSR